MSTPPALTEAQRAELRVLMTPAGFERALELFEEETIRQFVATRSCLLLAAADLLDGFPVEGGGNAEATGAVLKSFKLDVLEFQYAVSKTETTNYAALSKNLRERAVTECRGRRHSRSLAPEIQGWDLR